MPSTPLFSEITELIHPAAAYIGGKRKLAPQICRAIDRIDHQGYCEVFMGMGGGVFPAFAPGAVRGDQRLVRGCLDLFPDIAAPLYRVSRYAPVSGVHPRRL